METGWKSVFSKCYGWFTRFHVKSKCRKDAGKNLRETTKAPWMQSYRYHYYLVLGRFIRVVN